MSPKSNLSMWVVYDHPSDYPDDIVARKFETEPGIARPTDQLMRFPSIPAARNHFSRQGLVRIGRDVTDDPKIVETWL